MNAFSFETLDAHEANQLKISFEAFKAQLAEKVEGIMVIPNVKEYRGTDNYQPYPEKSFIKAPKKDGETLIAKVSHEIRTPLNGIIGFTDLLREDELGDLQLERVNAIATASYSLLEIINELLEYSKLSAGLEPFESIHFSFYGLVRDIVFLCKTLIVSKEVVLDVDMDPAIPEVLKGDPAKLSQVLLNLLGNAIKFVDAGEIALKIVLKKQAGDQLLMEFTVTDHGIGIDEEQLPFIFDAYRQSETETYSKYGGTGLGLSIVKQIIVHQGGDITVSSNLGQGTTFKFILPYALGDKSKLPKKVQDINHLRDGAGLVKGMAILVFEDNLLNQRLIAQRLKVWGCHTYITDNCQYGLNILNNQPIDLVLMDLRMPGMSGFEVTEQIRKIDNTAIKNVPIIALTADFTIQDKQESEMRGINDYILKPYSPDELLLKLVKNKNRNQHKQGPEEMVLKPQLEILMDDQELDLTPVFNDCMGEITLLEELVKLYKMNAVEFIGAAACHLNDLDYKALGFALHKIKAGLAMMRTDALYALVVEMQECIKSDKDIKRLQELYARFLDEYPKVETCIDEAVTRLKTNN